MANLWSRFVDSARYALYGPGSNTPSTALVSIPPPTPPLRTSLVFESHIQEAGKGSARNPQTISSAWDERNQWSDTQQSWQGLTAQDRKTIMLDIYLNTPAASSCVDVISKRIFSGGLVVEKIDEEGPDNKRNYDTLMEFCLRMNDDWDFLQLGRALIADELIFGESYAEIIPKNGLPWGLVKVDCIPMGYKANKWGQIERFYQQLDSTRMKNWLDPANIIRWWFPHPRASIDPFAPVEKVTDAVLLANKMSKWQISFFQKGAKFPFYVKGVSDQDEADRYMAFFTANNTGEKNAHKPMITWGTAELAALGNMGAMDIDFEKGMDRADTIVYGGFGVPPAAVSIIKTGAMGGHSEAEQDKLLIFNACDPVKGGFFEKLNDRVSKRGFGITDYRITSHYADYRSDKDVAEVEDIRIKNGSETVDEVRGARGKRPYKKGGSVPFIWSTKEVVPLERLDALSEEQRQTAQVTLDTAKAGADLAQTKAKQAKEPPPEQPPAMPGQPGQNQPGQNQGKNAVKPAQKPAKPVKDEKQQEAVQLSLLDTQEDAGQHTGMMVAFMIDPEIGQKIALHGGEPVEDLHLTLALLGNAENLPVGNVEHLKTVLSVFAANMPPIRGRVSGIGRFINQDQPEDAPTPVWASVDMERLQSFHDALIDNLRLQAYEPADTFAYQPHITLAYIDKNAPMPIDSIENVSLDFTRVCLAVGDERFYFPLLGKTAFESYFTGKTELPRWTDPDEDEMLASLAKQGVVALTWESGPNPCRICLMNDKQTVKTGMPFPSGHRSPLAHPHCDCNLIHVYGQTQEEDKDATQKLPVIKRPLKLTENDTWEGRL